VAAQSQDPSFTAAVRQGIEDGTLDPVLVMLRAYTFDGGHVPAELPVLRAPAARAATPATTVEPQSEADSAFFRSTYLGNGGSDSLALFHSGVELIEDEATRLEALLECVPEPAVVQRAVEVIEGLRLIIGQTHSDLAKAHEDDGAGETRH
jgi:hypothetical protein